MLSPHGNTAANALFAAKLAESGLTQAELADAVNAVVDDLTGRPGKASDRWVRMLLDGSVRWPRRHYRHALTTVLRASVDQLGFQAPDGTAPAPHDGQAVPASGPVRLRVADLARLRAPLDRLVSSADGSGGATLAPDAARHAAAVQNLLRDAVVAERVERAAYVLMGDYLAAAGWFALDDGNHVSAQRHLDAGLRAAGIARDGSLQTYVWSVIEKSARLRGDYSQALAVARTGLASATARRDPRIRAVFHALTAINLSRQHDRNAQRSLGRALDALGNATPTPSGRSGPRRS